jgi:hypothetical protein
MVQSRFDVGEQLTPLRYSADRPHDRAQYVLGEHLFAEAGLCVEYGALHHSCLCVIEQIGKITSGKTCSVDSAIIDMAGVE